MKESILNGKWVLGVNNNPDVLNRLEEKIKKAAPNCHFEKATTYREAFEFLVFFIYDLVILDDTLDRSRELLDFAVNRPFPVPVAISGPLFSVPETLKWTKGAGAKVVLPTESDGVVPVLEYIVWYESLTPLAKFFENVRKLANTRSESIHFKGVPDSHFPPRNVKKNFRTNIFTGWKQSLDNLKSHLNGYFGSHMENGINVKWPEWKSLSDINGTSGIKV